MKKILLIAMSLLAMVMTNAQNKVLHLISEKSFPIAELGSELEITDFSCEAWIYIDPVAATEMDPIDTLKPRINGFTPVFDARPLLAGNAEGCVLRVEGEKIGLGFERNNYWNYANNVQYTQEQFDSIFVAIEPGVWIHVAWTLDATAGTLTVYINGAQVDQYTQELYKGMVPFGDLLAIGGNLRIPDRTFIGKMDEIKLWSVVRSASEIADNYLKDLDAETATGLLAYYKCDDVAADLVLSDASFSGYNADFLSTNTGGSEPWETNSEYDFVVENIPGFEYIVSVKNTNNQNYNVFPNPATDMISVQGVDLTNAQINIYTLSGQLVSSPVSNSSVIDVANLQSGFYVVEIVKGSEQINFKLLK